MRRALIVIGIVVALVLGGAIAADAASPKKNNPCVNSTEFAKVKNGMTKAQVAKIFGTKGTFQMNYPDGHGYFNEVRKYKACKHPTAVVQVTFSSGEDLPPASVGWAYQKDWVESWTQ